jgi:Fe-S cluster assembly protein SufD
MIEAVVSTKNDFLSRLPELQAAAMWQNAALGLDQSRKEALAYLEREGFPTTKDEAWRHTSLRSLLETSFSEASKLDESRIGALENRLFADLGCGRLVFCNGHFNEGLSRTHDLPRGVRLTTLTEALSGGSESALRHLSRYANRDRQAFNSLNLALLRDGAVIEVAENTAVEDPIHVVFLNTADAEPFLINPRVLAVVGAHSQVNLVECHLGTEAYTYFSNPVTEIVAMDNSVVDYYKLQRESDEAYHISTVETWQGQDSNVRATTISLSGRLIRNDSNTTLDGEGGYAELNGLFLAAKNHHIDNYTKIEHAKVNCTSRELYKGILSDRAKGVFRGRIKVASGAQKTDSKQTNNNLLLSEDALINTEPQLEIYADDVKCTHGATVGQVDEDAIFYLRARGIGHETARSMLIYAFAKELVDEIKVSALRNQMNDYLVDWLPGVEASQGSV